jgi:hypothetical protein
MELNMAERAFAVNMHKAGNSIVKLGIECMLLL